MGHSLCMLATVTCVCLTLSVKHRASQAGCPGHNAQTEPPGDRAGLGNNPACGFATKPAALHTCPPATVPHIRYGYTGRHTLHTCPQPTAPHLDHAPQRPCDRHRLGVPAPLRRGLQPRAVALVICIRVLALVLWQQIRRKHVLVVPHVLRRQLPQLLVVLWECLLAVTRITWCVVCVGSVTRVTTVPFGMGVQLGVNAATGWRTQLNAYSSTGVCVCVAILVV
jgi:hypothetical protein